MIFALTTRSHRSMRRPLPAFCLTALMCIAVLSIVHQARAAGLRVLPEGEAPKDRRLGELKHLNAYFPFKVPPSAAEWQQRAAKLRRRVLVATGLWPMPAKTPLNPVIHGRIERDGFTVERVYFESVPNHFVTGLLFRPAGQQSQRPAVLCPHGHGGRLQDYGARQIRQLIAQGAERFEDCGRYPKLSRCAQLARMGCVTFIFDMIGYADSVQITREHAHRFAKQRPEFDTKESWGFFSTQAEMRLQSIMGLQTWNSIRALDFLCSLPDVDAQRVGVTGGSGGGTQTILLGAIDPRPMAAFPNGMVSTAMQGGCTCENCCLLRVGTGNVELTALFAPRPQGMTAADDWTREMMTKGFPELQQLYEMLDADGNVKCWPLTHFKHNYNYVTRALMYSWFNKHLKLGLPEPIVEEHWQPLTPQAWTVWDDKHPQPPGGADYERALLKYLDEQSNQQIAALNPTNDKATASYRDVIGGGFETIIGRGLPKEGDVQREKIAKHNRGSYLEFGDLIEDTKHSEVLPMVSFYPTGTQWNRQVVIWVDGDGKSGLYSEGTTLRPAVQSLVDGGFSVIGADLLHQGEFHSTGNPVSHNRTVDNPREYAGYTFGYNHTLFAQRVHDILKLVAFVVYDEHLPEKLHLVGINGAGPWVAAARAQLGNEVDRAAIDTRGFRFVDLKSYRDANFLPGAVKYGDLPGLLALSAPNRLWIAGEKGRLPGIVDDAYQAAGSRQRVTSFTGKPEQVPQAAADWLSGQ